MIRRLTPRLVLAVLTTGLVAGPAAAQTPQPPYLVELSTASTGSAGAQYVAIYATSSSDLDGARLAVQDSSGTPLSDFVDFSSPGPVDPSHYVLVATADAETVYGITATVLAMNASLPSNGGRLCLQDSSGADLDCVAWGQYQGTYGSWGAPVVAGGAPGTALRRVDHTGDNNTDWINTTPNPALYQPTGTADGGVGDGGASDAGAVDGGTADGGVADGGTTDGGVADAGGPTPITPGGGTPSGEGKVPLNTTGCSAAATGSGGMLAVGLLLAGLGLLALRRRRPVDPPGGRR